MSRTPPGITYEEIDERMDHHPPTSPVTGDAHATVRLMVKACTKAVKDVLPPSRETSLFLTAMQEALMWANAAIAINGGPRELVGLDDLAEIRNDYGIGYGVIVPDPAEPIVGSILRGGDQVTDAQGSTVDLAAGEVTRKN